MSDKPSAGKYELVALSWDQPKTGLKVGEPYDFTRRVQGDVVTLDEQEAIRLYQAGAVVKPGEREKALVGAYQAQAAAAQAAYEAALAKAAPDPEPSKPPKG